MTERNYHNPAALAAMATGDFANAIAAATPGGIERQESAGQQSLVSNFKRLPKDMDRATAEAHGFVYGADDDELFVTVTAPKGWRMEATDHSMHNRIVDAAGNERGSVFYKAAFYDRRADGYWLTRFTTERKYGDEGGYELRVVDRVGGACLYSEAVDGRREDEAWDARDERQTAADKRAAAFIEATHPDWRNVLAYWP
jgi:hypothetical protein